MASAPSSHRPVGGSRRDRLVDSGGGSGDDVISSYGPSREAGVGSGTNRTPTQSGRKKVGSVVGHVTDLLAKNFGVKTSASACVTSEKQPPAPQQLLCPSGSPTGCGTSLFATPGSSSRPPPSPRPVQTASATVRSSTTSGGNATTVVNSDTCNSLPAADTSRAFFYVPTATDSNLRSDQQQMMSSTDSGIGGLGTTSGHFPVPDDSRRSSSLSGPVSSSPPTSSASSASSSSPSAGANSPSRTGGSRGGGRSRFKKFLRPLRRTRSAGSGEDLNNPVAHAQHFGLPGPFGRRAASTKATSLTPPSLSRSSVPSTGSDDTDSPQLRSPDGGNSSESEGEESVSPPLSSLNIKETPQTINAGPKYGPRDIRRKFSWLRRHSDSAQNDASICMEDAPSGDSIANLPSRDSLRLWAESLDQLLADEYGQNLFREFLRSEFSEENLDFWLACERYRTSASTESLPTLAKDIYSDFVVAKAPREINLDCTTRQQTAVGILTPDRSTFQPAQKRIQALMERDPYRRFLESDVYLRLMAGSKPVSAVQSQAAVSANATVTSSPSIRPDPTVRQPTGLGVRR